VTTAHWKLQDTLRRHGKTTVALAQASGLTKTTVYNIVNGKSKAVELKTLGKLVAGLEKLTGQPMSFDDVLEREPAQTNTLLREILKDAKPFDWDEVKKHIPDWTPEERAENEAFLEALETQREMDRASSLERDQESLKLFSDINPSKRGKRE
jgi:DNA-binding Xre family transcriptional regulator